MDKVEKLYKKDVSRIMISIAHSRLTKYKREYAPDVHALKAEVEKILVEESVFPVTLNQVMGFQKIE
jgi:hypothetical protein